MRVTSMRAGLAGVVAVAAIFYACSGGQKKDDQGADKNAKSPSVKLAEVADAAYKAYLADRPEYATILGVHDHDDKLSDVTDDGRSKATARAREFLGTAEGLDAAKLKPEEKVTRELLIRTLRDQVKADELGMHWWAALDQLGGPQAGGFALVVRKYHPRGTVKDLENLVARYKAFGPWMDAYVALLAAGLQKQLPAPAVVVDRVVAQLRELNAEKPDQSSFLVKEWPAGISDDDKKRLEADLLAAVKDVVLPAYVKLQAYLESEYVLSARADPGLKALPNGEAIYAWLIEHHTTRALTPDDVHQMGLKELEKIEAEMMTVALSLKHKKGRPLTEFNDKLRKDKKNFPKDKAELLAAYKAALDKARAKAPELLERLPKVDVDVVEMDATRAPSAPAAYYEEADLAGTRKAEFVANLFKPETRPLFASEAITFHEGIPGHHVQVGLAHELDGLPAFRRILDISSFTEGWAVYAEKLSDELGLYASPLSRYGYLGFRAWRAARLVVDTGLHAKGWDRAKAAEFLKQHTVLGPVDVDNEVDRYVMWPGQALSYMVGALELDSLRQGAEAKLGAAFDRKKFHAAVLMNGAVPLDVLAQQVQAYADAAPPPAVDGGAPDAGK
ncbi:MAG: DUF885 domain-containing protein [Deltaproteobacteria bacterium]|nr:DUF885 domain-containing protein [Deltaproteobacteria bacterium]